MAGRTKASVLKIAPVSGDPLQHGISDAVGHLRKAPRRCQLSPEVVTVNGFPALEYRKLLNCQPPATASTTRFTSVPRARPRPYGIPKHPQRSIDVLDGSSESALSLTVLYGFSVVSSHSAVIDGSRPGITRGERYAFTKALLGRQFHPVVRCKTFRLGKPNRLMFAKAGAPERRPAREALDRWGSEMYRARLTSYPRTPP